MMRACKVSFSASSLLFFPMITILKIAVVFSLFYSGKTLEKSQKNDPESLIRLKFIPRLSIIDVFKDHPIDRIVFVSLLDGTIMGIDFTSGIVLWSINEDESLFFGSSWNRKASVKSNYIPSTSGRIYNVHGNDAEVIEHDDYGRTYLNKNYFIVSSRQDTITAGVNINSGKIYYYSSSSACFRNSTLSLTANDYDNLMIIKRTVKVVQMIDISSGEELIKFYHGFHELLMYHSHADITESTTDVHGLSYDVTYNVLHGELYDKATSNSNCWRINLSSPIQSTWIAEKYKDSYAIFSFNISDYSSVYVDDTSYNDIQNPHDPELNQKNPQCFDLMLLNYYNGQPYLHAINNNKLRQCKVGKILPQPESENLGHSDHVGGRRIIEDYENANRNKKSKKKSKKKDKNSSEDIRNIKIRVTWRSISLNKFAKLNAKMVQNAQNNSEIVMVFSVFALWKEILSISTIISLITIFLVWRYKKYKKDIEDAAKPPLNDTLIPEPQKPTEAIQPSTPTATLNLAPTSRYHSDFDHIESIGTGGFGVVFKARNLMDDCVYAVKRVTIPDCVVARQKVMREVKALAKLNNPGIIRFYNAWFEDAPDKSENQDEANYEIPEPSASERSLTLSRLTNTDSDIKEIPTTRRYTVTRVDSTALESDDDIVFNHDSQNPMIEDIWENVESSSSVEASRTNSDLTNATNMTNTSIIMACNGLHNCLHDKRIFMYIQMELCHKQTLKSWLLKNISRTYPTCVSIFKQILFALDFIHTQGLIHRDLKPSNIFFAFDGSVKIGDFGLVTGYNIAQYNDLCAPNLNPTEEDYQKTITKMVGTEMYMGPEQLEGKPHTFKVDIYALGLIFFELLSLYQTLYERAILFTNIKRLIFPTGQTHLNPDSVALISQMLSVDPSVRPCTKTIISGEIFTRMSDVLRKLDSGESSSDLNL